MPTVEINQFKQIPTKGQIDLQDIGSVLSGQVFASEAVALVPGQAVTLVDNALTPPVVTAVTSAAQAPFAIVLRNIKDINYPAKARLELALSGSVVWMEANGAIARGAPVEYVVSGQKVATSLGVNSIIGQALDKAAADGDLIRVMIRLPLAADGAARSVYVEATLAEINAGKELIPGITGKKIQVSDYVARVTGAFATGTSVDLQSTTAGTKVTALAQAGLTNGAVLTPASSNTTLGAGFGQGLEAGQGLSVVKTGSNFTGGTKIGFTLTYSYVS